MRTKCSQCRGLSFKASSCKVLLSCSHSCSFWSVKYSFGVGAPNLWSCAAKIFNSAPKNFHLVAQGLPKWKINFEPWQKYLLKRNKNWMGHLIIDFFDSANLWQKLHNRQQLCSITRINGIDLQTQSIDQSRRH